MTTSKEMARQMRLELDRLDTRISEGGQTLGESMGVDAVRALRAIVARVNERLAQGAADPGNADQAMQQAASALAEMRALLDSFLN